MSHPNFVILYVSNPLKSAAFYRDLFGLAPLEASPGFALFKLESGMLLGLWAKDAVEPSTTTLGGGSELVLALENDQAVDTLFAEWRGRGLTIAQQPTRMDFGYTFVALDLDQHRLRVYTAGAA